MQLLVLLRPRATHVSEVRLLRADADDDDDASWRRVCGSKNEKNMCAPVSEEALALFVKLLCK